MLSAVGSPELARAAHVGAIAPPIGRNDARRRAFGIGAVSLACVGSPGWVLTSTIASDIAEYRDLHSDSVSARCYNGAESGPPIIGSSRPTFPSLRCFPWKRS